MTYSPRSSEDCHLLIVSDNRLLADATGSALRDQAVISSYEYTAVGAERRLLRATDLEPRIVILDACCFGEPYKLFGTIRRLTEDLPESQFIVLARDADANRVSGCVASGAGSFVLKTESLGDLSASIKALKDGHSRCCDQVMDVIMARIRELAGSKKESANNTEAALTEREVEILRLVEEGLLNKEIARRLGVALSTVKNHLHSAFEKLQVDSRRQAVSQAIALGVLECHAEAVT